MPNAELHRIWLQCNTSNCVLLRCGKLLNLPGDVQWRSVCVGYAGHRK